MNRDLKITCPNCSYANTQVLYELTNSKDESCICRSCGLILNFDVSVKVSINIKNLRESEPDKRIIEGKIKNINAKSGNGEIEGVNKKTYLFKKNVSDKLHPIFKKGLKVKFVPDGDNATSIEKISSPISHGDGGGRGK